jgi:hypothetical protein
MKSRRERTREGKDQRRKGPEKERTREGKDQRRKGPEKERTSGGGELSNAEATRPKANQRSASDPFYGPFLLLAESCFFSREREGGRQSS